MLEALTLTHAPGATGHTALLSRPWLLDEIHYRSLTEEALHPLASIRLDEIHMIPTNSALNVRR